MTEEQIKKLGFELVKQYPHDQFHTNRYRKGLMHVEFTYERDYLISTELTVEEINCMPVGLEMLNQFILAIGDWEN